MTIPRRSFLRLAAGAAALRSSLPFSTTIATQSFAAETETAPKIAGRTVKFRDGALVPALGQGSWHLADGRRPAAVEEEALRTGLSLGMRLIDTAEVYGGGKSEELVGRAIAGQRDRVFLVSKVWPTHVMENGTARACEASLARLGTDHLDLYLLHWPSWPPGGLIDLSVAVTAFESLRAAGKIRAWGVSNFDVGQMEKLFAVTNGDRCAANQVFYNLGSRGIEYDLLPWCKQHGVPVMAYTPLGNGLVRDPTLAEIGAAHGCSAAAVALAWAVRSGNVIAIPESGSAAHVKENAVALSLELSPQDLQKVDAAYPPPATKVPLERPVR
jgi:diketogulonate reductase-like aldo/keto reductase